MRPGCPAGSCCHTLIVGFWQIMHGTELKHPAYLCLGTSTTCRNFYTMPGVPSTRPGKRGFTNKLELDESNPHATLPPGTFVSTWPAGEALTETPDSKQKTLENLCSNDTNSDFQIALLPAPASLASQRSSQGMI